MATPSTDEILNQIQPTFNNTLYPYSYAVDLLREYPHIIPTAVTEKFEEEFGAKPNPNSRKAIMQLIATWANMEEEPPRDVCEKFADAYLTAKGIIN